MNPYCFAGQVAARLGLDVRTVRNFVREGKLKAIRVGKQYRISTGDLVARTGRAASSFERGPLRELFPGLPVKPLGNLPPAERGSLPRVFAPPIRTAVGFLERIAQGGKGSLAGFEPHAGDPPPRLIMLDNGENGIVPTREAVGYPPGLL